MVCAHQPRHKKSTYFESNNSVTIEYVSMTSTHKKSRKKKTVQATQMKSHTVLMYVILYMSQIEKILKKNSGHATYTYQNTQRIMYYAYDFPVNVYEQLSEIGKRAKKKTEEDILSLFVD